MDQQIEQNAMDKPKYDYRLDSCLPLKKRKRCFEAVENVKKEEVENVKKEEAKEPTGPTVKRCPRPPGMTWSRVRHRRRSSSSLSQLPTGPKKENDELATTTEARPDLPIVCDPPMILPGEFYVCQYEFKNTKTGQFVRCGKKILGSNGYKIHSRTHLSLALGKNTCEICKKSFPQKSSLNRHLETHAAERKHVCNFEKGCTGAFKDPSTLLKHYRTHTGEKPFKCQYCSRPFSQSGNQYRHESNCNWRNRTV